MGFLLIVIIIVVCFYFIKHPPQTNGEKRFAYNELTKIRDFSWILDENKKLSDAYQYIEKNLNTYAKVSGISQKKEKGYIKTTDGVSIDCIVVYQENHSYNKNEIQFIFTLENVANMAYLRIFKCGHLNNNNYIREQEDQAFYIALLSCIDSLIEELDYIF